MPAEPEAQITHLQEALGEKMKGPGFRNSNLLVKFIVGKLDGHNLSLPQEEQIGLLGSIDTFLNHREVDPKTTIFPKLEKLKEKYKDAIPVGDFEMTDGDVKNMSLLQAAFEELNAMWNNPQL